MPFIDPNDNQPFGNGPKRKHREYVPAEWEPAGGGSGHPKISGGETESRSDGPIASRGLNRRDQRYEQPEATLIANRQARAAAEYDETVVLQGAAGIIELRALSGNNYDLSGNAMACDCPDFWRLRQSGYDIALCKHCYIAQQVLAAAGGLDGLDKSCSYVAEFLGVAVRTVQQLCQRGVITASHDHEVWVIPWDETQQDEVAGYHASMIYPGENPFLP